jgi:uncharacterized protein
MSNAEVLGRFVWHELITPDTAAAASFYAKVVPWRTAPSNMPGYTIWMSGQTQIGGLMTQPSEMGNASPHWLVYVATPNVDNSCAQAHGLGARICKPPADIPNVGRFAVLADPQGAVFALFTPGTGAPPPPPAQGGFSWHELATTDVAAALRFYGELFGWRKGPGHDMGPGMGVYQIFEHAGTPVGGMHAHSSANAPAWLSYIHVADASRAVAAAKAAGGRVFNGPMEVPGGSRIAVMGDPQGGAFAVQELPRAEKPKATPPTLKPAPSPKAAKPASPEPAASAPAGAAKPAAGASGAPKPAAAKAAPPKAAAAKASKPKAPVAKRAKPSRPKRKAAKKKVARKKAVRSKAGRRGANKKSARRAAPRRVRRPGRKGARRARGRRR